MIRIITDIAGWSRIPISESAAMVIASRSLYLPLQLVELSLNFLKSGLPVRIVILTLMFR
jgi:hypothetical protein